MKNYFVATTIAARITGMLVEEIRTGYRKGAKPEGKTLNAVIITRQIYKGTFRRITEPAVQ